MDNSRTKKIFVGQRSRLIAGSILVVCIVTVCLFVYPYWRGYREVREFKIESGVFTPYTLASHKSMWIHSEANLQGLITELKDEKKGRHIYSQEDKEYWTRKATDFERIIRANKVDFTKESLILVLTSGYSSSKNVGLSVPWLSNYRLVCKIWSYAPGQTVRDWVHHGFALVVPKDMVSEVEIWENGKQKENLFASKADE